MVDDGSKDESRQIITDYGDKIIAVLKENGGQASALNAGVLACRGDVLCFGTFLMIIFIRTRLRKWLIFFVRMELILTRYFCIIAWQ